MDEKVNEIMSNIDKELEAHNKLIEGMLAKNEQLGPGVVVGKVFYTPVADGRAYYEVTKTNIDVTEIKHRPDLSLDGYVDHVLVDGGIFSTSVIRNLITFCDGLVKHFI